MMKREEVACCGRSMEYEFSPDEHDCIGMLHDGLIFRTSGNFRFEFSLRSPPISREPGFWPGSRSPKRVRGYSQ